MTDEILYNYRIYNKTLNMIVFDSQYFDITYGSVLLYYFFFFK